MVEVHSAMIHLGILNYPQLIGDIDYNEHMGVGGELREAGHGEYSQSLDSIGS